MVDGLGFVEYADAEDAVGAPRLYVETYLVFSYKFRLSFCSEAISCLKDDTVRWQSDSSFSNWVFLFLNLSLWAVIIGRIPDPPPTGSPDLKASKDVVPGDPLGSNPEIIDDVGDARLFRAKGFDKLEDDVCG